MIKRLSTGILIIVFLFNSGGYYFCFRYYQHSINREVKHMIRNGLSDNQLSDINIPYQAKKQKEIEKLCGICWIKPGKEFSYKGQMYDVVKTTIKNGQKHYFCINDKKEKKLLAEFLKLKTRKLEKRVKTNLIYYYLTDQICIINNGISITFNLIADQYYSAFLEILTPPPTSS